MKLIPLAEYGFKSLPFLFLLFSLYNALMLTTNTLLQVHAHHINHNFTMPRIVSILAWFFALAIIMCATAAAASTITTSPSLSPSPVLSFGSPVPSASAAASALLDPHCTIEKQSFYYYVQMGTNGGLLVITLWCTYCQAAQKWGFK